ncbi:serine/threonine protein kinase [Frankia sp. QA3]|uniref:serine/threonine protein kinase n=1 Tax=Frankia sp. QA3 TaxID=710111 RepID=UPI000269C6F0|nr:serine/threonine protein kinase [Frankia sp. QA3]EIV94035.1 protein kinase family protein [Frankia sp. QA3]
MAKSASVPPDTSRHGTPRYVAQRYRLDTPIGRGGAGVVWRGEDELLQRPVAIKEILVPMAGAQNERDAIRARVLREARALARLHSPAIVSVYDVVEEHQRHWIIMELVDADSLGDVIRTHGPLPFDQVAAIGLALTDALAAAHSAGVLHRDVKPGNVLLGRDGRVRLTDFGIAATEGDVTLTGTGALVGSPAYIAPERVRGSSGSPASDLWGLGATLYSAVEGQPPFEGPETYAVLTAVVEGRRRAFRLAGPLRNLLSDLMDRPAEERPDVTEIRRRLIPVARNANPVPASVMHARPRSEEDDGGASAADVGLENLDEPAPPAPSTPIAGGGPAAAHPTGRTGPAMWNAASTGAAAPGQTGGTGPRTAGVPVPPPGGPIPSRGTAESADTEITADPVLGALDETAISPATGGGPRPPRHEPARPATSHRTRPQADHDAHTRIGPPVQATGPTHGGADDETRIGTVPVVASTASLGLFDDDHAAGLVPLDEARRHSEAAAHQRGADGHGRGPGDAGGRRRRTIAIAAGAVAVLVGAAIALTMGLSGSSTPAERNDVTAPKTTAPPTATVPTSPPATIPQVTPSAAVTPETPHRTPRRPRSATPAPEVTPDTPESTVIETLTPAPTQTLPTTPPPTKPTASASATIPPTKTPPTTAPASPPTTAGPPTTAP